MIDRFLVPIPPRSEEAEHLFSKQHKPAESAQDGERKVSKRKEDGETGVSKKNAPGGPVVYPATTPQLFPWTNAWENSPMKS